MFKMKPTKLCKYAALCYKQTKTYLDAADTAATAAPECWYFADK